VHSEDCVSTVWIKVGWCLLSCTPCFNSSACNGFMPCLVDPNVWMHPAMKPDGTPYYKYVLCYVDDVLLTILWSGNSINERQQKNYLVLRLWASLHREANKVITTMVTLPAKPITCIHLTSQTTIPQHHQSSTELIALTLQHRTCKTQMLYQILLLCSSPMTDPMTAAQSTNATDNEQPPSHHSPVLSEDTNPAITSTLLHQQDNFYNGFDCSSNSSPTSNAGNNPLLTTANIAYNAYNNMA